MSSKKYNIFQRAASTPQNIGVGDSELEITALAAGGRGLAHQDRLVWFIQDALPGDLVLARPLKRRKRFVEGQKVRLIRPSPQRRKAPCPFQDICGGCPWMPLDESIQRDWKRRLVEDALSRIGGLEGLAVEQVSRPVEPLHYRNRLEMTLGKDAAGKPVLGFHPSDPAAGLVDVDRCLLQHESANRLLTSVREILLASTAVRRATGRSGADFRLTIRRSWADGRLLVVLRETSVPFPHAGELARSLLSRHPELNGIVRLRARPGRRGGASSSTEAGRPWLEERIGGILFRTGAATFVQVSTDGAAELVRLVSECAGVIAGGRVLDLYGGIGLFSLSLLANGAGRAVVCDADGEAIACGRQTAARLEENRIKFFHDDAGRFMKDRWSGEGGSDLVVANPPRSGLDPRVVRQLLHRKAARLVLVSCDPATLARDLSALVAGGYRVERVAPVDLFPQTAHIETVSLLVSGEADHRR
jgi:23S rRNA (uracil1939-C5)-methyltransferase